MGFQPVIPMGGLAGWAFLNRTLERQSAAFETSADMARETGYFSERIGGIDSAGALVSDRRLLGVALGAFGLQDDIDNRFFIRKMLEEGTVSGDAFANRMADDRYKAFSRAFGFGDVGPPRASPLGTVDEVLALYRSGKLSAEEIARDDTLTLLARATDVLAGLAGSEGREAAKWNRAVEDIAVRQVFQTALQLPAGFGQMTREHQIEAIRGALGEKLGDGAMAQFAEEGAMQRLGERFLVHAYAAPRSKLSDFPEEIVALYRDRSFEVAVGEQDANLRLALNAQRELSEIAGTQETDDTKWYRIMGNEPLRRVFETALGLPGSFGQLDLDQQLAVFRDKAERQLGDAEISQFGDPAAIDKLVQRFLVRAQLEEVQTTSAGSIALTLLQGAAMPRAGLS